jgi:hypothetical protein
LSGSPNPLRVFPEWLYFGPRFLAFFRLLLSLGFLSKSDEGGTELFWEVRFFNLSFSSFNCSILKIKIKKLYLDREFFSVAVISWLIALEVPFIMPAIRRGKTGGINQFLKGKKSYKTHYTMSSQKDKSVTFELWIVCRYRKGKRGKNGVEYLVYVVHKVKTSLSHIRESYRQRFGIESSYRLKNVCRIRTTTKNPIVRLLFVGISFLLVNIWVNFLWQRISQPRRGGRLIYYDNFTLKQMLSFLRQAVDQIFETVKDVYIPKDNSSSLPSPAT